MISLDCTISHVMVIMNGNNTLFDRDFPFSFQCVNKSAIIFILLIYLNIFGIRFNELYDQTSVGDLIMIFGTSLREIPQYVRLVLLLVHHELLSVHEPLSDPLPPSSPFLISQ